MPRDPNVVVAVAILAVFVIAAVVVWVARRLLHRSLLGLDIVPDDHRAVVQARARHVMSALKLMAYGIAALASVSLALPRFGIRVPRWGPRELAEWLLVRGVRILAIVVGALVVVRASRLAIEHLRFRTERRGRDAGDPERSRRTATLAGIAASLVTAVVGVIAVLMVLHELAIDVLPLLTGAGIAGLAIGFGAQNLVRDVISGFFLILEDQIRVGDIVKVNSVSGTVEELNLRTIVLRDVEGAVHVFPNGTVTSLANLSKDFSYALVDIAVGRGENLDRVMQALREVGAAMQADPALGPQILEPIEVLGVEAITAAQVTIRVRFKTAPLKHIDIARELRRRVVIDFGARGISRAG